MAEHDVQTRFRVSGMDCAGCASKIDGAVRRIEGVGDVSVTVTGAAMTVMHDGSADLDKIRKRVTTLGYGISDLPAGAEFRPDRPGEPACGHDHDHDHDHDTGTDPDAEAAAAGLHGHDPGPVDGPWWGAPKARLTLATVAAVALAYVLGLFLPGHASWFFGAAVLVGLVPIARRAVLGAWLARAPFSVETLMTIAAAGALILGATQEAAVVVVLFLVGEMLEGVAAGRARSSISALTDLVPRTALIERDGETVEVDASELAVGTTIRVRPGDRIPADGVILSGAGAIDESPVTGESTPVEKRTEDAVYAGTVNGNAGLRVRVTAAAQDNTIARIVRLVEQAQESKAPTERFIDRFSRYYTPGVVVVATLVAILPPLAAGASWSDWVYKGLAILLIGCPCALVISTPAAIASALSAGARRGLLIKGGAVLEDLRRITAVAFDKTGTLTTGKPVVTDVVGFGWTNDAVLRHAAALETGSSHPLAAAILERARTDGGAIPGVREDAAIAGKGVSGRIGDAMLFLGAASAALARAEANHEVAAAVEALQAEGKSVSVLVSDDRIVGAIAVRDEPRADARHGLAALERAGIRRLMLTGDNPATAEAIGRDLGIEVKAGLLPEDKQAIVSRLRDEGHRVAKVGDGINDAPALAAADVGIAMGGGTDVALETGDAATLHGRIGDIVEMIDLSRRTMRNIRENISIALGLKGLFLITTIVGLTGLWPAILADTGATVLVTANALRLLGPRLKMRRKDTREGNIAVQPVAVPGD